MTTTCLITGRLVTASGSPMRGETVTARPDLGANEVVFADHSAVAAEGVVKLSDENGEFSLTLSRGLPVILRIDVLGLAKRVTVPDRESVTLEELIDGGL